LSTAAALLAHALYARGQYAEAEEFSRKSEEVAAADDVWSQVPWRSARAKALAQRGELDQAEALAREAVALAGRTEFVTMHGDALLDLGEVLRFAGRTDEAAEVAEHAARLFREKGNVVSAERADMFLAELGPVPHRPRL
jgi:tetratricopeptide (TPR) repeat protein